MMTRVRQKDKEVEMRVIGENEKQKRQMISIYYKNISRSPALGLELYRLRVYNINKSPPTP